MVNQNSFILTVIMAMVILSAPLPGIGQTTENNLLNDEHCGDYQFKKQEKLLSQKPPIAYSENYENAWSKLIGLMVKDDNLPAITFGHELLKGNWAEHERLQTEFLLGLAYQRLGSAEKFYHHIQPLVERKDILPPASNQRVLKALAYHYYLVGDYTKALKYRRAGSEEYGLSTSLYSEDLHAYAFAAKDYRLAICYLLFKKKNFEFNDWTLANEVLFPLYWAYSKLDDEKGVSAVREEIKVLDKRKRTRKQYTYNHQNLIDRAELALRKDIPNMFPSFDFRRVKINALTLPVREKVLPEFPEAAKAFPLRMVVDLNFKILENGGVGEIKTPELYGRAAYFFSAKKALSQWKFQKNEGKSLPRGQIRASFEFFNDGNGHYGVKAIKPDEQKR